MYRCLPRYGVYLPTVEECQTADNFKEYFQFYILEFRVVDNIMTVFIAFILNESRNAGHELTKQSNYAPALLFSHSLNHVNVATCL